MPINPVDLDSLGGAKTDAGPVRNASTTLSADEHNAGFAALAEMSRPAPMAIAKCTLGASPSTSLDVGKWSSGSMHIARTSSGVYTLTWPASVLDSLGTVYVINFRGVTWSLDWAPFGTVTLCTASVTSANEVTVKTWNTSGVAAEPTGAVLNVVVY